MLKLLSLLIYGHDHDWQEISHMNVEYSNREERTYKSYGHEITYRCSVCKRHKTEKAVGWR